MENNAFSSPTSETNTASPNSPPLGMALTIRQNFPEKVQETRDFGAEFFSMYRSIVQPKSVPGSLSLTPSTRSSSPGDDDENATEHRLNQACMILERQERNDHFDLYNAYLHDLNKENELIRRENAELRSANNELLKMLSSPSAFNSFLHSSTYTNQSFVDSIRSLDIGGGVPEGHGSDELSDISPTSVMQPNRFERQPNAERISLPKSISVRSSGYHKVNQPGTSRDVPTRTVASRPRVLNQSISGTQKVFVPGVGGGGRKREEEAAAAAAAAAGLELEVYNQGMFKTELCNKWQQTGTCPYGDHCQFAHGITELRPVIRHPRYKTEICRMVLAGDKCPYGHRCHFRHSLTEQERLLLPR
ncbi:hypothetical protein UlMin_022728 [Ulmus minor]